MSVYVRYDVPVWVRVEPSTREVLAVHVDDEQIGGPLDVADFVGGQVSAQTRQRAIDVAEAEPWPGWTFGC